MKCLRKYLIKCIKHFKKKLTRESDKKTTNVDSYYSDSPIRNDKEEKKN